LFPARFEDRTYGRLLDAASREACIHSIAHFHHGGVLGST
jgi:hypothetical protein